MQLASVGFGTNTPESGKADDIIYRNRREGDHPGRIISLVSMSIRTFSRMNGEFQLIPQTVKYSLIKRIYFMPKCV